MSPRAVAVAGPDCSIVTPATVHYDLVGERPVAGYSLPGHCCGNDREAARHNKSPWPGVVFQFLCPFGRSRQEVTQAKFFWPVFPLFGVDSAGGTGPS